MKPDILSRKTGREDVIQHTAGIKDISEKGLHSMIEPAAKGFDEFYKRRGMPTPKVSKYHVGNIHQGGTLHDGQSTNRMNRK